MINLQIKQEKPAEPQNIFKNPIARQREERIRSKNVKKGYTYLFSAAAFLMVYSIGFLYPQVVFYLEAPGMIQGVESEIKNYDDVILPNLKKERDLHEAAYNEELKNVENKLNEIFPAGINKIEIIKRLENFATSIDAKTPPFEFNSIAFSQPEQAEEGYTVLPIKTSIHSSTANFDRFLQLISLSGMLDSDIPVRLMEISTINISYRGIDPLTGEDKGVDFAVTLNAYSRQLADQQAKKTIRAKK
jgi:hypothetical protein